MKNTGRVEWIERLREYAPWHPKNNSTKPRSSAWAESKLGAYFENLKSNTIETYARKGEARRVHDINVLLSHFGDNASRVPNRMSLEVLVPLMLFYRAHSAFKAAATLGLGGAITEAMPVLRLCLECAGYASITHGNFVTAIVWLYRFDNDQAMAAAANNALWNSKLHESIARRDVDLAGHYQTLHERLAEFGAHQNELGVTSDMLRERKQRGGELIEQICLQDNSTRLDHWLRAAGQVGVCLLKIFELLFPTEFRELGLSKRIPHVAKGLDDGGLESIERAWRMHIQGRR
jgi:hypothetical protein